MKNKYFLKNVILLTKVNLFLLLLLTTNNIVGQTTPEIITSGSSSWTSPVGITSFSVEVWGGGGAGGGCTPNKNRGGSGGTGGTYVQNTYSPVGPTTYNYVVGASKLGTSGANGANGNFSWFSGVGIQYATGGLGGKVGNGAAVIGSSTGSIGTTIIAGGNTVAGTAGGIGSAGSAGANGGGAGGATNAPGSTGSIQGFIGTAPGGGGGGGATFNSNPSAIANAGGTGERGEIRITYLHINSLGSTSGCVGSTITINGTDFIGATASNITIGGMPVTSIVSNNGTQIVAVIGAGITGLVSITIVGKGTTTSAATFTVNSLPTSPSNPSSDSPQCPSPGVTITRVGTPLLGETWYWQTVSGGTSTTNSGLTFTATATGTYYIRAQNNATGCWSAGEGSIAIVVNPSPANPGNPTSNSPQCLPTGVTLTRSGIVPGGITWYWQTVPGGTSTSNSAATYNVTTSGTYYIRAQNNTTGCWSAGEGSATVVVTALALNPGNPTSNSPQCSSPGVILSIVGSAPIGETWYWQTVSGGTSTINSSATYIATTSGTYYIRSRNNTSLCWSTGEGSLAVVVTPSPANPTNPTSNSPQCLPTGVTLTRSGTPPVGETWYWQTTALGTNTTNSLSTNVVTTSGTYYIRSQNNTSGCWSAASGSVTVVVNSLPLNPLNPSSNSPQCSTPGVTLTRVGTVPGGETWYWQTVSGGTSTTSSAATYLVTTSGTYYIRARNNTSLCWSSGEGSITVVVNQIPANPTNPTSNSPQCTTPGVTLTRVGSVPVGETWYWQTIPSGTATTNSAATNVVTTSGTYYIRAQNNSTGCWSAASGSVTVVVNAVPTASITPSPANAATGVCFSGIGAITSVSWTSTAGATSYDVYFGAGSLPGTLTANVATNAYTTGPLLANTTYYWSVVAKNICGNAIGSSTWTFTTSSTVCNCSSTSTSSTYFIKDFSTTGGFSNISNINSGYSATGYGNFTTQIVSQVNSGSVSFLTDFNGNINTFGFNIWVDWNDDSDFNDAGELVYASGAYVTGASGSFTVPATASIGNHRMRIRANYLSTNPSACGTITSGETEDYTFTVAPPLPCSGNPSSITVLLTSQTTSTVSWTAASPAPANGYQYYLFTSNTYPTGFTGSTAAGVTSVNLTGLISATTYYVWVRSNCGGGLGQGVWIGPISFTQPNCALGNGTGTTTLGCPSITSGGFGLNDVNPPAIDCTTSGCANLEATYLQLGETTNYTVQAIPYSPPYQYTCLRNPISVNVDDVWSPVINLPFNFCFYGNSYSSCVVGSNGVLCFDTTRASTNSGWSFSNNLPSTTGALFANTIYGVYHDIDPSKGGKVGWELITLNTGCRALVAAWSDVPMFSNNTILYTGMMVLYENTNVIEVFIKEKAIDNFDISPWNGGNSIVGLQNATATAAVVAPGRNSLDTNWEVYNEAWRFTPSGASIATLKWYEGLGTTGPIVGTTPILNVCPAATTTYTAEVTYTLCNGVTIKETDEATVTVTNGKKWDGSVSADWNVAANWTPDGVPTSSDCVVIPDVTNDPIIFGTSFNACGLNLTVLSGATLQINSTNTLTITDFIEVEPTASLTVKNSASLIQVNDSATNTGNIIMERSTTIRKTDYVYWSTPVESFSSSAISPGTSSSYIYKWHPTIANTNGGEGNWVSGNETMIPGKGYIVRGPTAYTTTPAAFTATFIGKPNNGIITTPISRGNRTNAMGSIVGVNGVTITPNDDNFNLLGNPYPSAIDALSFLTANTNIIGNVSIWTHGTPISPTAADPFYADYVNNYTVSDYINYNGTGSTPPGYNGKIASGQGFFVIMNDGTANTESVTFNNSLRSNTYTNNQFYRANNSIISEEVETDKNRIWVSLINAANVSFTALVGYVPDATYGDDRLFDAPSKIGTAMGIYSMINDKSMLIQGRPIPFDQNDIVPLAISIPSAGNYTIAIGLVDGLFENETQEIYLEDTQLGIIHDLRVAPYSFDGTVGIFESRFKLRYTNSALGNGNFDSNQTFAFINNNSLQIQSNQNILEVAVYEVSGKLVKTYKPNQIINHLESEFNFSNGIYLAKIKLESGIIVSKKLIN